MEISNLLLIICLTCLIARCSEKIEKLEQRLNKISGGLDAD